MTINFTMLAQNSDSDYVKQACLCAMSIKVSNENSKICLITNNTIPKKYQPLFDNVVKIPWNDSAENQSWKILNRWKIYHAMPFENSFILDTDMIVLNNIDHWWQSLQKHELIFTSKVKTYRNNLVTSSYYRKAFIKHNLPNVYSGLFYLKKCDFSLYFFKFLEIIFNNWEKFQGEFAGGTYYQKHPSFDILAAIAIKILGLEHVVLRSNLDYPTFTHMKTFVQDWKNPLSFSWQDMVGVYLNNKLELKIGNYAQNGIFHYTEKNFITDDIISIYEKKLGI